MIRKNDFFKGCLRSFIAHAIMTNIYPALSYEQSWDESNFSIQNSQGIRGTVTFSKDFCVCGIRNETGGLFSQNNYTFDYKKELSRKFPSKIIEIAETETLQYLLIDYDGKTFPNITSVFWCDDDFFGYHSESLDQFSTDLKLFKTILMPEDEALEALSGYYEMDDNSIRLLKYLFVEKANNFNKPIILNDCQKSMIPGGQLNDECKTSLRELKIY